MVFSFFYGRITIFNGNDCFEAIEDSGRNINASIIATDIDTNVLQYAANGIYRYSKSSKEFPAWIKPQNISKKRRVQKKLFLEMKF